MFKAACDEAEKLLRDLPVTRVLNRLDVYAVEEIKRALAQHFAVLLRNAAEGIDVNRRPQGDTDPQRGAPNVVRCARRRGIEMTKRKPAATLPSGHAGVYRADDGKRWEAYVMEKDLVLLGVYATKRAAVAARARYWKAKERIAAQRSRA